MLKNWTYGCRSVDRDLSDIIYAAHAYRNKLCELELAKRDRHYEILRDLSPEYLAAEQKCEALEKSLDEIRQSIQTAKSKQRTKKPTNISALTARATEIRKECKEARAGCKEKKLAAYQNRKVKAAMEKNTQMHKAACSQAKKESNLYWGTEAVVSLSCKSFSSGPPPRFKRYQGTGQLAVQLQGGLDCDHIHRPNTLVYIDNVQGNLADAHFRVASQDRKPVFAKAQIVLHRPLPAGKIKWAYLEKTKLADRVRWSLRLTIDCEDNLVKPIEKLKSFVAVHFGWHMQPNGLSVAMWRGSDGKQGAIVLGNDLLLKFDRINEIRSQRDVILNEVKQTIATFRKRHKAKLSDQWLEMTKSVAHWKSPIAFAKLILYWRENRVAGDTKVFNELNRQYKHDKRMWQNHCRLSKRTSRHRSKHLYREFAAKMAAQYDVLYYAPLDVKKLNANAKAEELAGHENMVHRRSSQAAIGELTQSMLEKFPLRHVAVSTINLSRECSQCGTLSASEKRKVQCIQCGKTHDIDENAIENTISRGKELQAAGALQDLEEKQRLHKQKQRDKLANMQEAARKKRESDRKKKEAERKKKDE